MKAKILGLILLTVPMTYSQVESGEQAPSFFLKTLQGSSFYLSRVVGPKAKESNRRPLVLSFFATSCKPCEGQINKLGKLRDEFPSVDFYLVNINEGEETVEEYVKKFDIKMTVLMDRYGVVGKRFGIIDYNGLMRLPSSIIIAASGTIEYVDEGFSGTTTERYREHLAQVTKQQHQIATMEKSEDVAERSRISQTDRKQPANALPTSPPKKITSKVDNTPPTIQITSPVFPRGVKKLQQDKTVVVKGLASDASGIFEVRVNGVEAELDANGQFWSEVLLRVGENRITVEAMDIRRNAASTAFTIVRETRALPPPVVAPRTKEQEEFQFGEYHALLIAVQDYADGTINDLDYPIEDAERIRAVLLEQYTFKQENIHFLKNPSRRDILKQLGKLRKLDEDDNLLIYYAGHGYWDEKARQGYWLPRDARQDDDSDWISNSDIKDRIRSIETRHTLLISDACFSGGIFKTREAFIKPDISIQKVYEMPSRKALTSGNLKTVPDKSVFVEYLVKRLEKNREPYLYSEKLYVNMKDAVTNNSPNNQTPLFGVINGAGDEGGDFIFVRKR